jgi:hypothetical protein
MSPGALIASIFAASVVVAVGGCGDEASETTLRIRVANGVGGHTYQLHCDPPGGSAPQPDRLCATLAAHSDEMLFSGKNQVCIGGFTTAHIYVSGQYRGKRVSDRDLCGHPEARPWGEILPPPPSPLPAAALPQAFPLPPGWSYAVGACAASNTITSLKLVPSTWNA